MKLTDADQQLLSVIRENARASTAQIAVTLLTSVTMGLAPTVRPN